MKFWAQIKREPEEDGGKWWIAYFPDFDRATQGETLEEAREMAQDLLLLRLMDTWAEGREVSNVPPGPEPGEWEQVGLPQKTWIPLSIKRARVTRKKTMKDMAAALGVSVGTYQRWEDPYKFNATVDTLEKVAAVLGKRLEVALV